MKDLLDRSFHLALSANLGEKSKKCELYLAPPEMSRFGIFDMDKIDEIIDYSYQFTIKLLEDSAILKSLS
jgi:NTE family protein